MREQRLRGQQLTCECGRILRAITLLVLRQREVEHYRTCDVAMEAVKRGLEAKRAQGDLFEVKP